MATVENIGDSHALLHFVVWEWCGSWVQLWERYVCIAFPFYQSIVHCLETGAYNKMSLNLHTSTYFPSKGMAAALVPIV